MILAASKPLNVLLQAQPMSPQTYTSSDSNITGLRPNLR